MVAQYFPGLRRRRMAAAANLTRNGTVAAEEEEDENEYDDGPHSHFQMKAYFIVTCLGMRTSKQLAMW